MVYENKIPIENKKPFETVQELKGEYKTPSFEEFMKSYNTDEVVNENYQDEFDGYGDIRINRSYGPGNSQSQEQAAKFTGRKIIGGVAGGLLGPVAVPVGMKLKEASITIPLIPIFADIIAKQETLNQETLMERFKQIDGNSKNELSKWIGDLGDELIGSGLGSIAGEFFPALSEELSKRGSWELGEKIKEGWGAYEDADEQSEIIEPFAHFFNHMVHTQNGEDYNSECEICKA